MTRLLKTVCLITLVFPASLEASTYISEIAWMGSLASANHEWIEIHNSGGTTIDVTGWTITDSANLVINLSGEISANTYAVVERSSDASAPGTAFLIYTGALVNTGATLTLRNQSGQIIDQVAGGENWSAVGGDNVTKETAQYTESGWGTGEATPGAVNVVSEQPASTPQEETSTSTEEETEEVGGTPAPTVIKTKSTSNKSTTVLLRDNGSELVVKPEFQKVAYVNQKILFSAKGSGVGKNILASLKHSWNFGDSFGASGKEVEYYYRYPGNYVVTIFSEFGDNQAVERAEITVLPVTFSLSKSLEGDIQLNNDAGYDIDISGYQLVGQQSVVMPARTVMLAKSTITIEKGRLVRGPLSSQIALYDQKQNLVATLKQGHASLPKATETELTLEMMTVKDSPVISPEKEKTVTANNFNFLSRTAEASQVETNEATTSEIAIDRAPTEPTETMFAPTDKGTQNWPYLVFIGLLFLTLIAMLYGKKGNAS